jgi:hypothetical protein
MRPRSAVLARQPWLLFRGDRISGLGRPGVVLRCVLLNDLVMPCQAMSMGYALQFAFTSPLIILLLVHLGISTITAASGLIFRIALYVLLKLAVVPDLSPVVDTQLAYYTTNPCPSGNPCNRVLHAAIDSKKLSSGGKPEKTRWQTSYGRSNVLR